MFKIYRNGSSFSLECVLSADRQIFVKAVDVGRFKGLEAPHVFARTRSHFRVKDLVHKNIVLPKKIARVKVLPLEEAYKHLEEAPFKTQFKELVEKPGNWIERLWGSPEIHTPEGESELSFEMFLRRKSDQILRDYDDQIGEVETVYWSGEEMDDLEEEEVSVIKEEESNHNTCCSLPQTLQFTSDCGKTFIYRLVNDS